MNAPTHESAALGKRKWLSVGEAADYLGISQPTVFRWMKEGLLSFYKVGGSTRFSPESLDAVMEKTTGRREAEAAAGKCAVCGNSLLVEGTLQGTGRIYFKPLRARFWTFSESLIPTVARTCTACGHIQIHADTEKLNRIRRKEVEESAEA